MGTLIYCASGNPRFARTAVECGWKYGARLPSWFDRELTLYFADQDWKKPDREAYMQALQEHRPEMATVLDWEQPEQFADVMAWATEAAKSVQRVVVIPKVSGMLDRIPNAVGGVEIVLGYSVPTSYGGTTVPLWEFGCRPVHLLGGSPQAQLRLRSYLNVVSADGGMAQQQATKCRYWSRRPGPKGHWMQLGGESRDGAHLECFRRSMVAIREAWV